MDLFQTFAYFYGEFAGNIVEAPLNKLCSKFSRFPKFRKVWVVRKFQKSLRDLLGTGEL